jgi:hypothetical protein
MLYTNGEIVATIVVAICILVIGYVSAKVFKDRK